VALWADPDRLLTAVLFWNLLVNLGYFTLAAVVVIHWNHEGRTTLAGVFTVAALLTIIALGEMLPKNLAVLMPRRLAVLVAVPLAALVRAIDPLIVVFRVASLLSQRLIWPGFEAEPYLNIRDLERAVRLSVTNAAVVEREQRVLESIVLLSEVRVDEVMRPRTQFRTFRPPIALTDLAQGLPASGYVLVTERGSDEVAGAIALTQLPILPDEHLETLAQPVVYVPWCIRVSEVLELIRRPNRPVAAIVNEFGETIGVLTFDDILDTIFSGASSRSERLLRRSPIRLVRPGVWHVTGMTTVRRLVRQFQVERPASKGVTVAGVIQEALERMPQPGDECQWGPFHFRVLDVPQRGRLLAELTVSQPAEAPA
jgi:putative hemolysin